MHQPTLFAKQTTPQTLVAERLVIRALGEFQARGKVLAERELPLDRLRGALRRAAKLFDVEEMTDEQAVSVLIALGASVRQVPAFVAKHPYRITVQVELAERGVRAYQESLTDDASR